MIKISNLSFGYKSDQNVINNLSLNIEKGKFVAILGHNGSGKSTLSKLLIGLIETTQGEIKIMDKIIDKDNIMEARSNIGIIFQNPDNQFVGATVKEDIAFGLQNKLVERDEMLERIDRYSKEVDMYEFLDREPHLLSGGQKQRVAIAGVLAMDTEIIIFDESTSMLDPKGKSEIINLIKSLNERNKTIIMITHDLEEAKLADELVVMKKGEIILQGTPEEVFKKREILKEASLDVPMALNVLNNINCDDEKIKELLWELSLKE